MMTDPLAVLLKTTYLNLAKARSWTPPPAGAEADREALLDAFAAAVRAYYREHRPTRQQIVDAIRQASLHDTSHSVIPAWDREADAVLALFDAASQKLEQGESRDADGG